LNWPGPHTPAFGFPFLCFSRVERRPGIARIPDGSCSCLLAPKERARDRVYDEIRVLRQVKWSAPGNLGSTSRDLMKPGCRLPLLVTIASPCGVCGQSPATINQSFDLRNEKHSGCTWQFYAHAVSQARSSMTRQRLGGSCPRVRATPAAAFGANGAVKKGERENMDSQSEASVRKSG
jgi:hypothetical protein